MRITHQTSCKTSHLDILRVTRKRYNLTKTIVANSSHFRAKNKQESSCALATIRRLPVSNPSPRLLAVLSLRHAVAPSFTRLFFGLCVPAGRASRIATASRNNAGKCVSARMRWRVRPHFAAYRRVHRTAWCMSLLPVSGKCLSGMPTCSAPDDN